MNIQFLGKPFNSSWDISLKTNKCQPCGVTRGEVTEVSGLHSLESMFVQISMAVHQTDHRTTVGDQRPNQQTTLLVWLKIKIIKWDFVDGGLTINCIIKICPILFVIIQLFGPKYLPNECNVIYRPVSL